MDNRLPTTVWERYRVTLEDFGYDAKSLPHYYWVDLGNFAVVRDTTRCGPMACRGVVLGRGIAKEVDIPAVYITYDVVQRRYGKYYLKLWFEDFAGDIWLTLLVGAEDIIIEQ